MDYAAVAKKIREAVMDHAEHHGRCLQDTLDGVIEGVLRREAASGPMAGVWYADMMQARTCWGAMERAWYADLVQSGVVVFDSESGRFVAPPAPEEWR